MREMGSERSVYEIEIYVVRYLALEVTIEDIMLLSRSTWCTMSRSFMNDLSITCMYDTHTCQVKKQQSECDSPSSFTACRISSYYDVGVYGFCLTDRLTTIDTHIMTILMQLYCQSKSKSQSYCLLLVYSPLFRTTSFVPLNVFY